MIATKEQERKALAKIRKIVEELGEDSYVATAFEGCFEKAEENIENDWAGSWKQEFVAANDENIRLKEQIVRFTDALHDCDEVEKELYSAIDKLRREKEEIKANRPCSDDLYDLLQLARTKVYDEKAEAEKAAKEIVENAENPDGDAFKEAVGNHRWHNGEAEYWQAIVNRVEEDRKRMMEE